MALPPDSSRKPDERTARDTAQKDVLLREVDEALREDEMLSLARRYGLPAGIALFLGLAALGGWLWWHEARKDAAGKRSEQLTLALDRLEAGNLDAAKAQLAPLAAENSGGTSAAAKLLQGGIALEQGRKADAVKLFGEVAADTKAPQPFRDLATLREVATNFDAMPPADVVSRLKPLAVPGKPWFGPAGELLGLAYLKQGNEKLAGPLFASIARDKQAPETLRRRARQMAGVLGVDAIDDPERLLQEDAGPAR